MAAVCRFEQAARDEYHDSIRYYSSVADDERVALRFIAAFEAAMTAICDRPELWRVVGLNDVRRYVLRRFPFVIYYRYLPVENSVTIYAVMHTSRQPDVWRARLPPAEG